MIRSCKLACRGVSKNGEILKYFDLGKLHFVIQGFSPSGRIGTCSNYGPTFPFGLGLGSSWPLKGNLLFRSWQSPCPLWMYTWPDSHRYAAWPPLVRACDPAVPALLGPGNQSVHEVIPSFISFLPQWHILHTEVVLGCVPGHHPQTHPKHLKVSHCHRYYLLILASFIFKRSSVSKIWDTF